MNILQLQTNYISSANPSDNVNLYTTTTGNIIAGAVTTTLFNLNAKSIQLSAALTSHNGNISVGANTISNSSFVLTGNVGNVTGANLTFGVASSSGSYSTTAVAGDVVVRTSGANNLLLQTGQAAAAIKIDSSNNVNVANYLLLNSTTTDNLRAGTGSGGYFFINNAGNIGYNTGIWNILNTGAATFTIINTTGNLYIGTGNGIYIAAYGSVIYHFVSYNSPGYFYIRSDGLIGQSGGGNWSINSSGVAYFANLNLQDAGGNTFQITSTNNRWLFNTYPAAYKYYLSFRPWNNSTGTGWDGEKFFFYNDSTFQCTSIVCTSIVCTTLTVNGNNVTSDYRIKSNVRPVEKTIDNLRPVSYFNKLLDKESHGFIAHEVAEHFPELVNGEKDAVDEKGEPKYQSMDYIGLISVLTREIQELKANQKILIQRITVLEQQHIL